MIPNQIDPSNIDQVFNEINVPSATILSRPFPQFATKEAPIPIELDEGVTPSSSKELVDPIPQHPTDATEKIDPPRIVPVGPEAPHEKPGIQPVGPEVPHPAEPSKPSIRPVGPERPHRRPPRIVPVGPERPHEGGGIEPVGPERPHPPKPDIRPVGPEEPHSTKPVGPEVPSEEPKIHPVGPEVPSQKPGIKPVGPEIPDIVPSPDDEPTDEGVVQIDFDLSDPSEPTDEQLSEARDAIGSTISNLISSFFGPVPDLNSAPSAEIDSNTQVETETKKIPGGFMVIQRMSSPFEKSEFQAAESIATSEVDQEVGEDGLPLPPPPPFFQRGPFAFLHRFFGPPPPPPPPFEREADAPPMIGERRGCKKGLPLLARIRDMMRGQLEENGFPPMPPPIARHGMFANLRHDDEESDREWNQIIAGPFMRANFGEADMVEAEDVTPAGDESEQEAPVMDNDGESDIVPPSPAEIDAAEASDSVAPYLYAERDYRAGDSEMAANSDDTVKIGTIEEASESTENSADPSVVSSFSRRYGHRDAKSRVGRWFKHHKTLVISLSIVACFALLIFTLFMCRRRQRLLAAAQQKQFAMPPPPSEGVQFQPLIDQDQAIPVQAYSIQLTRPLLQH